MEFTEDEEKKLKEAAEILDRASRRAVAKLFRELADIVEREGVEG
ncbi:unnamed protein product [marine sediment metagenome]|uniref:Uncharacterized protein n=1 Tax=marine sediment metagenome TaxID=412755 RepID=X1MTF3_9ZZZZ